MAKGQMADELDRDSLWIRYLLAFAIGFAFALVFALVFTFVFALSLITRAGFIRRYSVENDLHRRIERMRAERMFFCY
jgi:hypothetical protein